MLATELMQPLSVELLTTASTGYFRRPGKVVDPTMVEDGAQELIASS